MKVKMKVGNQIIEYEVDAEQFKTLSKQFRNDEQPHIHHSEPHTSKNVKFCDLCQKEIVKHYHVCEECFKFMRESLVLRIRELEEKIKKMEAEKNG